MSDWKPYLIEGDIKTDIKRDKVAGVETDMTAKVLCLFDSPVAMAGLAALLGPSYETECVPTILAALQSMKRARPDVIVVQLHLRDESCFDFLRTLENNPQYASIPVITCSVDSVDKRIEEYLIKVSRFLGSKIYVCSEDFYTDRLQHEVAQCVHESQCANASLSRVETA